MDTRTNIEIDREIRLLKASIAAIMPGNPVLAGFGAYSQCDEDGIIQECLSRVSRHSDLEKTFVEIGCGNGLENNTRLLLMSGYRGVWVDGNSNNIFQMCSAIGKERDHRLLPSISMVSANNAEQIAQEAKSFLNIDSVDFLSLDIDGNDYYVMPSFINILNPKIVCVEYNAKFPPPIRLTIKYDDDHAWGGDDYFGSTLQLWNDYFASAGYTLVCCNLSGVNAFFIRNDLMIEFATYDIGILFQPARYWLVNGDKGHPSSFKWLTQLFIN